MTAHSCKAHSVLPRLLFALFALITALSLTALPCTVQSSAAASAATAGTGHLAFSVLILDDLTPKPVPLTEFSITNSSGKGPERIIRTDLHGRLGADLPAGGYKIESVKSTHYKGHWYYWDKDFKIVAGHTTKIDLTDADALTGNIARAASTAQPGRLSARLRQVSLLQIDNKSCRVPACGCRIGIGGA